MVSSSVGGLIIFFYNSVSWVELDTAPPTWDDAMYLNQVLSLTEAAREGGHSLFKKILDVDPGRVPVGLLLAVPLSYIFGPFEKMALLAVNLCWPFFLYIIVLHWKTYFLKKSWLHCSYILRFITDYSTHYSLFLYRFFSSYICFNHYSFNFT